MTNMQPRLLDGLGRFARTMQWADETNVVLHALTVDLTESLELGGSAVLLATDGGFELGSGLPPALMELHHPKVLDQGPGPDAHRLGRTVVADDLAERRPQWPEFCERAADAGIVSVVSAPLRCAQTAYGVVEVYDVEPRQWRPEGLAAVRLMADLATCFLTFTGDRTRQVELVRQLRSALESRVVVEQAKGVLSHAHSTTPDDAFERLRRYARSHNANLHDVAEAVVHLGLEV